MKKTILILLLTGFATALYAGPITPEKALKVAEKVLSVQPVTKSAGGLQIIWDGETAATKAEGQDPAFYVVGRDGGGFVIVAGNDNVRPVLALSYTNRFQVENMPCNVSAWMERIKRYSRTTQVATAEVRDQWDAFAETKGSLLPDAGITGAFFPGGKRTVEWNQREPGNLMLPTASGETDQAISGCVAVAMAEIMTWFKYPAHGTGTVSGYTSSIKISGVTHTATIPAHSLGTEYDWDGMESLTDADSFSHASDPLKTNIAQLFYDIGTILQLKYSATSTEGNVSLASTKLSEHMGYSRNARVREREMGFPAWQWDQMLVEEVTKHPVFYSGTDPNDGAGHAYVLDGYGYYKGNVVFHFNFGWSGYCNGYYSSDYQAPDDERVDDTGFGEYHYVDALFDFYPDEGNNTEYVYELSYSGQGMTITIDDGNTVVLADRLCNTGSASFRGTMVLLSGDKESVYTPTPLAAMDLNVGLDTYYTDIGWAFGSVLSGSSFGDKLAFFYSLEGSDEYKLISGCTPASAVSEVPFFPAAFIKTKASYSKGDYFYFRLTNHDFAYPSAKWTVTPPSGSVEYYNQDEDRFQLTKSGEYTIKVTPYTGAETIVAVINVN